MNGMILLILTLSCVLAAQEFRGTILGRITDGGILFAGVDNNPRRGGAIDANNIAPRFGLAWQLTPKTVLRGGYGLFYSVIANNTTFRSAVDTFNAVTSYRGTDDGGATIATIATIATTLADPFPAGLKTPIGSGAGLMAPVGDGLTFFDDKRVSPYNQQRQFSLQRELPMRIVADAAYVGMLSLKGVESYNVNEKPDRYLALGNAENTSVANPFHGILSPSSALGNSARTTQGRFWVRFPQFRSLTIQGANTRKAIYHSLQTKIDKRLSHGLNVILTYTLSQLVENYITSLVNERHCRSVSGFDQKHVMRMAFVDQMPFRVRGRGVGRLLLGQVPGNWRLSGYMSLITGEPLSVSHANGRRSACAPRR